MARNALGLEFGSGSDYQGQVMCGTVYGDMHLKDLLGSFIRRVLYPGPEFLSSAIRPLLSKKQYNNGLINQPETGDGSSTLAA